jgi:2-dehydro-3-deoxyphosphogluconate aldolase/(4S)-4-hydroxy-2-oxoglutarate aldolase
MMRPTQGSSIGDESATAGALETARLIAIVRSERSEQVLPALAALTDAGAAAAEISLNSRHALRLLQQGVTELGERLLLGAGTVRTPAEAEQAIAAGARFLVSPDLNRDVVAVARRHEVLHLPGIFSPSELSRALESGARLVKLFPAGRLGPGYVRDLLAPFPEAKLVPTGGIGAANTLEFLRAGAVAVAIGSELVNEATIGEPDQLRVRFRELDSLIQCLPTPEGTSNGD